MGTKNYDHLVVMESKMKKNITKAGFSPIVASPRERQDLENRSNGMQLWQLRQQLHIVVPFGNALDMFSSFMIRTL